MIPEIFLKLQSEQADALLVTKTAQIMTEKLSLSREKGRGGWHSETCSNQRLRKMLLEHVEKGDPVDIIIFAAMIKVRESVLGEKA